MKIKQITIVTTQGVNTYIADKNTENKRITKMKKLFVLIAMLIMAGCSTDADIASHNLSKAADMFEIDRRIVFYNGITDTYMLTIEGRCSIEPSKTVLRVTCKTGHNEYKKHYLGLSDNVTYFAEQLESKQVSVYYYKVIFKPQSIIPDIDIKTTVTK